MSTCQQLFKRKCVLSLKFFFSLDAEILWVFYVALESRINSEQTTKSDSPVALLFVTLIVIEYPTKN